MSFVIGRNLITPGECMCQLKAFWYRAGILLKWSNTIRISLCNWYYFQYISDYSIGYVTVQLVVYTVWDYCPV
jgi:hypothetical protein